MVGGLQAAARCRTWPRCSAWPTRPGLLPDPELAARRMRPAGSAGRLDAWTRDRTPLDDARQPAVAEPAHDQRWSGHRGGRRAASRRASPSIGLWREQVAEHGLERRPCAGRDAGLRVSSPVPRRLPHRASRPSRSARWTTTGGPSTRRRRSARRLPGAWWSAACRTGVARPAPRARSPGRRSAIAELAPYAGERRRAAGARAAAPDVLRRPGGASRPSARRWTSPSRFPAEQVGVVVDTLPRLVGPGSGAEQIARAGRGTDRLATRSATGSCRSPPTPCCPAGMMGDGLIDFATDRPAGSATPGTPATSRWRSSTPTSGRPIRPRRSQRSHAATSSMCYRADPSPEHERGRSGNPVATIA